MAKAAKIVPVRVLDCDGSSYSSDVVAGIDWIAGDHEAGEPAMINMSMGGFTDATMGAAVQGAIDDGVTVVAAAGNDNPDDEYTTANGGIAQGFQGGTISWTSAGDALVT